VGQDFQAEVAALAPVGDAANVSALSAFDHGDDGFNLGAITIGSGIESCLHEPAIVAGGRLVRWPAAFGWNDRPHAALFTGKTMIGLGVVAGVGGNSRQAHPRERLDKQGLKLDNIELRSASVLVGQDEMRLDVAESLGSW